MFNTVEKPSNFEILIQKSQSQRGTIPLYLSHWLRAWSFNLNFSLFHRKFFKSSLVQNLSKWFIHIYYFMVYSQARNKSTFMSASYRFKSFFSVKGENYHKIAMNFLTLMRKQIFPFYKLYFQLNREKKSISSTKFNSTSTFIPAENCVLINLMIAAFINHRNKSAMCIALCIYYYYRAHDSFPISPCSVVSLSMHLISISNWLFTGKHLI